METEIANAFFLVLTPIYNAIPLRNPQMGRGQQLVFLTGGVVLALAIAAFSASAALVHVMDLVFSACVVIGGIFILAIVQRDLQPAYRANGEKIYVWNRNIRRIELG